MKLTHLLENKHLDMMKWKSAAFHLERIPVEWRINYQTMPEHRTWTDRHVQTIYETCDRILQKMFPDLNLLDIKAIAYIVAGDKIGAIKMIRQAHSIGLKDAKDVDEHLQDLLAEYGLSSKGPYTHEYEGRIIPPNPTPAKEAISILDHYRKILGREPSELKPPPPYVPPKETFGWRTPFLEKP